MDRKTIDALWDHRKALADQVKRLDRLLAEIPETDLIGHPTKPPASRKSTKRSAKMKGPMPIALGRIRGWFGHKTTTMPAQKERDAYDLLGARLGKDLLYEQCNILEEFYEHRSRRDRNDADLWSHDSITLINNWDAKHATAIDFLKDKPKTVERIRPDIPEPLHWRQWAMHNWPNNDRIDFSTITWKELGDYDFKSKLGIQLEIHRNCK